MNIEVMKLVRDNIKMGSVLSFAEVMIIQQALDAAMLQGAEQTNYRAIVERIAEIVHGKVTDIDLLTVTVKSMKDKLHK